MEIFKKLDVDSIDTDFKTSKQWNGAFYPKTEEHLHRNRFFRKLSHTQNVIFLIQKELKITFWDHIIKRIKYIRN